MSTSVSRIGRSVMASRRSYALRMPESVGKPARASAYATAGRLTDSLRRMSGQTRLRNYHAALTNRPGPRTRARVLAQPDVPLPSMPPRFRSRLLAFALAAIVFACVAPSASARLDGPPRRSARSLCRRWASAPPRSRFGPSACRTAGEARRRPAASTALGSSTGPTDGWGSRCHIARTPSTGWGGTCRDRG